MKKRKASLRKISEYHDNQTEYEALAEDEKAYSSPAVTMHIPAGLVPFVRSLIAKYENTYQTVRKCCEVLNRLKLRKW